MLLAIVYHSDVQLWRWIDCKGNFVVIFEVGYYRNIVTKQTDIDRTNIIQITKTIIGNFPTEKVIWLLNV